MTTLGHMAGPRTRLLWGTIGSAAAASLALGFYIFDRLDGDLQKKVLFELSKTLVCLPVVLVLGGLISEVFKKFEQRRQDALQRLEINRQTNQELQLFRHGIRKQLNECYLSVKRCRRALRVAGLTDSRLNASEPLTETTAAAYREQLEVVNSLQLDLEKIRHEVGTFARSFSECAKLAHSIKRMSFYLLRLVKEYETNSLQRDGGDSALSEFSALRSFTGPTDVKGRGTFKSDFCDRYSRAVELIRCDLLRSGADPGSLGEGAIGNARRGS